jgi:hypothetical protein
MCLIMCRKCRFKRLFLGIGSALRVAEIVGIRFSAVDGCHMKHVHYRDGIAHLCTTLDGNNKALLLAFALCETESCATWEWFADRCQKFGISAYFELPNSSIIGDRMKGIERFVAQFPKVKQLECFRHIIDNIYRHTSGRGKGITVVDLWKLRNAETWAEWFDMFKKIGTANIKLADYIWDGINGERVWRYLLLENKIATFERSTNQLAEGQTCGAQCKAHCHVS